MRSDGRADPLLAPVEVHYERAFSDFGETARGVDWRDEDSQSIRFRQLDRLCLHPDVRSVCDLGCGYAAYLTHLRARGFAGRYVGVDVVGRLVQAARDAHDGEEGVEFVHGDAPVEADAVVASGTFNVALDADRARWEIYVWTMVRQMWVAARVGIGFNLLSLFSDLDRRSSHLYYASPHDVLRKVQVEFTPHVEVHHQYGLYEFTVIARREPDVNG